MARLRSIGKYGNSFVIKLTPLDMKDLQLQEGDEIDIEDMVILNKPSRSIKSKEGKNNG